ncbi:DinB family protein [Amycolatopsis sp. FDAARGOS 1241]|uniref:DinB family protein n=1 Tax=Amycolatopsis sp. FDAARGOS 1241 TaxID=2778070 RepID=UPI00195240D9|nr:DinB family protein [Amycolatopsis sp. FDAARGOS 1241]QRP51259.1 DinB family protein [Amycolatopsis sp. FDAARGOS 1241]
MVAIPKHFSTVVKGEREAIPRLAGERETLGALLDWHRRTFAIKCAGLGQEELSRKAVGASALSLHGILRHLSGVERWWFRQQFAREEVPMLYYSDDDPDQDFASLDGDIAEATAQWHAECDRSREIVAAARSLEDRGASLVTGEPFTLRWLLLHMIAEYARHNGHADLLRESIDGSVGR